jgi:hypothetical protein
MEFMPEMSNIKGKTAIFIAKFGWDVIFTWIIFSQGADGDNRKNKEDC